MMQAGVHVAPDFAAAGKFAGEPVLAGKALEFAEHCQ